MWWTAEEAEAPTLELEHYQTNGDHYGTVQTACPVCQSISRLREERDPPIPVDEVIRGSAHV